MPAITANKTTAIAIARSRKKRTFAIDCVPEAIPVKPKNPATTEIRKKMRAHLSADDPFSCWVVSPR